MITEKLYQKDVYMKKCNSTILELLDTEKLDNPTVIVLDQTVFFPTGGGQPCDLGTIDGIPVVEVYEKDGIVYHKLSQDQITSQANHRLTVGQTVVLELDWQRRFYHMQRHCGEHILSGMFYEKLGGVNRGFHMGESYMTIDIDIKDISWEQAMEIEHMANKAIWSNFPVSTRYYKSRDEAEKLPLRKALALDDDIIIVCVGSEDNPADCVACCGTHPSTSGQVGTIKITKLENYKGMTRVYFKAGEEAFWDYQKKNDILAQLNRKYSADELDLIEKIKVQEEKNKAVRQELHELKTALISKYTEELRKFIEQNTSGTKEKVSIIVLVKEYPELKVDELLTLGRQISTSIKGLLILVSSKEYTALLFSNGNPDCGKLVRDNASIYQGKGGGNPTNARAIFTKKEYLDTFIDLLQKHLK